MEMTIQKAKELIAQYEKEYAEYKAEGGNNKYIHSSYVMDIGNLYGFLKDQIKVHTIYRCMNNRYIWCNTKNGENHFMVVSIDDKNVHLGSTWEEEDDTVTGSLSISEFWDIFEESDES